MNFLFLPLFSRILNQMWAPSKAGVMVQWTSNMATEITSFWPKAFRKRTLVIQRVWRESSISFLSLSSHGSQLSAESAWLATSAATTLLETLLETTSFRPGTWEKGASQARVWREPLICFSLLSLYFARGQSQLHKLSKSSTDR